MGVNGNHIRLGALLGALVALAAYAAMRSGGGGGGGPGARSAVSANCPATRAPAPATVDRRALTRLRHDVGRVTSFDPALQPYEQGLADPGASWSDAEPDAQAALSVGPRAPGGYEMRWWMPDGDDVVADGFVFRSARAADRYLELAATGDCRSRAATHRAPYPPGGRNLSWLNPDSFAQEDLFIQRDRRVYRVAVVKAGAGRGISDAARARAFSLVNGLACLLPAAGCHSTPASGRLVRGGDIVAPVDSRARMS